VANDEGATADNLAALLFLFFHGINAKDRSTTAENSPKWPCVCVCSKCENVRKKNNLENNS
jgi:hypothetical protein